MNKNNNNLCNFEKKYIEPISNYVVVSFSLFYIDEYIRHKRSSTNNISESRQLDFIYNMTCNINLLDLDIIPSNWYFRIYYDNSMSKNTNDKIDSDDEFLKFIENRAKNTNYYAEAKLRSIDELADIIFIARESYRKDKKS